MTHMRIYLYICLFICVCVSFLLFIYMRASLCPSLCHWTPGKIPGIWQTLGKKKNCAINVELNVEEWTYFPCNHCLKNKFDDLGPDQRYINDWINQYLRGFIKQLSSVLVMLVSQASSFPALIFLSIEPLNNRLWSVFMYSCWSHLN